MRYTVNRTRYKPDYNKHLYSPTDAHNKVQIIHKTYELEPGSAPGCHSQAVQTQRSINP